MKEKKICHMLLKNWKNSRSTSVATLFPSPTKRWLPMTPCPEKSSGTTERWPRGVLTPLLITELHSTNSKMSDDS